MAFRLASAVAFLGAASRACLPAAAISVDVGSFPDEDLSHAVGADDQCAGGGDLEDCALNALQVNRVAQDSASGSLSSRRRKNQAEDLSVAWQQKVYAWSSWLHKNTTLLEWKMFYYKMDMNSTNNSIFDVPGLKGVNGTKVNWNKHPATWLPTFSGEASFLQHGGGDEDGALAQLAVDEEHDAGRPHSHLGGVPPRKKRMQVLLTKEQDRLSDIWSDITFHKRRLNWIGNYMGSNRRLYHGRPVFAQGRREVRPRPPHNDEEFAAEPEPQTDLVEQIQSAVNQSGDLWIQVKRLGGMIEAMKHRAHRYRHGQ